MPGLEKLDTGMTTDITGTAGNKDVHDTISSIISYVLITPEIQPIEREGSALNSSSNQNSF